MKLKYLSVLLLSSLILPVCTYASSTSFEFSKNGSSYNPATFTTDGGVLGNLNLGSCSGSNKCAFQITDSTNTQLCYVLYMTSSSSSINTCDNLELSNGEYNIKSRNSQGLFSTLSFDIVGEDSGAGVVDPENPEISLDVLGSFKTILQGLVSDLVVGFYDYFPLVIVIGIGVLMIYTLWGYIRHASSEIFTLNRKGKKSLSWFQNEDIVNMYSNWKKDRVSKHDINNIIENTVDHTDEFRAKTKEFYDDEYNNYSLDQWKKDFYSGNRQGMSWVDSYSDEANYQKNIHRRVADRLEEYFDNKYGDGFGMQAVKLRNDDDRSGFAHYNRY